MTQEEESQIEAEFKRSELRWRLEVENDIKELVRLEQERAKKYDVFLEMLMEREHRHRQLSDALIVKSLGGALWAVVLFVAYSSWAYIKDHLK